MHKRICRAGKGAEKSNLNDQEIGEYPYKEMIFFSLWKSNGGHSITGVYNIMTYVKEA